MTAFLGGLTQFFIPTHLLAIVALGLLAGQQARVPLHVLIAFAIALAAGSLAVAFAIRETPSGLALLVLAGLAAGLVVAGRFEPFWLVALLALAIGAMLPLNAPPHEITIAAAIAAQIGFAIAALATFSVTAFAATQATRSWQRIGLRIAGSWIAASAILVLALRLAR